MPYGRINATGSLPIGKGGLGSALGLALRGAAMGGVGGAGQAPHDPEADRAMAEMLGLVAPQEPAAGQPGLLDDEPMPPAVVGKGANLLGGSDEMRQARTAGLLDHMAEDDPATRRARAPSGGLLD